MANHNNITEIEKKYYIEDKEKELLTLLKENNYKFQKEIIEEDEYFTDLEGKYIENRTCLRIRTTKDNEDQNVEITYKGKSEILNHYYAKKESNVNIDPNAKNEFIEMLEALGYYSYVNVIKKRKYYSKKINDDEYNVLIDNIGNVGIFIEVELLTKDNIEKGKEKYELSSKAFEVLNLKTADKPYRDFTANSLKDKANIKKNIFIEEGAEVIEVLIPLLKAKGYNITTKKDSQTEIKKETDHILVNNIKFKNITQLLLILLYS